MKNVFAITALSLFATATQAGEAVTFNAAGQSFAGVYEAAAGAHGTVVVFPTFHGLSDHEIAQAARLAGEGWNALAADLYPQGALPTTMEEKEAARVALTADADRWREILTAAVHKAEDLAGGGDIVVIGYSVGGGSAMELVRSGLGSELGIDGYGVFSGRVTDPEGRMIPDDTAPIFVAHGSADARIPVSGLTVFADDLDLAGIPHRIEVYEGMDHMFMGKMSPNYDAASDAHSWAAFTEFLAALPAGGV